MNVAFALADHPLHTEEVWSRLHGAVRSTVASRVRDAHAVDDLVQDTFLRAMKPRDWLEAPLWLRPGISMGRGIYGS